SDRLQPGAFQELLKGDPLPQHTDAVLAAHRSELRTANDGTRVLIATDELTGVIDEDVRPALGSGITRQAAHARIGSVLVPAGRMVGPGILALAAALGHDTLPVVQPPRVGTFVLGHSLLAHGLPRAGRRRDALGDSVAYFAGLHGARSHPPVRAPDSTHQLMESIDDAQVDVLIIIGEYSDTHINSLRQVISDLGARWLLDGVAMSPGEHTLLAKLPDGRFIVGLSGYAEAAIAGLVTIVEPLLRSLAGSVPRNPIQAVLVDDIPADPHVGLTRLIPVLLETSGQHVIARGLPKEMRNLHAIANADGAAVLSPDIHGSGQSVPVLAI
ncbi:MAG: hypothetical protein Q8L05_09370, partial [Actinomycetota bacterium]|nr:hypothetical protein [Actinomycetota bacterium]